MKLPRPITALVVLSLAILSAELRAQTPAPSTRPVPLQPESPPTITVEFPGGTVAQLIELLAGNVQ